MAKASCFKLMTAAYLEKAVHDRQNDGAGRARSSLPRFLLEYYVAKYGAPKKAESHLHQLLFSVHQVGNVLLCFFCSICFLACIT
jgi:hypothetical protein